MKAWQHHESQNRGLGACLPRGRKPTPARARTPEHLLSRVRGNQGATYKSGELRELLWDWFVDIRASVATYLTPKIVKSKAKDLAEKILQQQRLCGCYAPLPSINRMWLLRWKRDKGVTLRKPNARFKCSKEKLMLRLRAMWINVIKVRYLASCLLDNDLSERIFGIDEKPLHMNEGGSKNIGTLEVAGAETVALKQNHAQTRERVSLMTSVSSCPAVAASGASMPLELLFRAKSNKRTRSLTIPPGMRVSVQYCEKGSYRTANIMLYLQRWLDPWTELRAARKDWRILLLDVAKSHLAPEVIALCHERGYCCMYHYGCTTGVAQVNDTHLHGEFSHIYLDLEQIAFCDMQLYDPSSITRSLQAVLDDSCGAWRACCHLKGVAGHKNNGLSNALDGSEDHLISTSLDAGKLWQEMNLHDARQQAKVEVDEMLASGDITSFEQWQKLVVHPTDPGVRGMEGDGSEFDGEKDEDLPPWMTDEQRAMIMRDDAEVLTDAVAKQLVTGEVEEPLRLELAAARRLARLKELRASMVGVRVPASAGLLDSEIRQVTRGLHAGGVTERQEASATIRAMMEGVAAKEREEVAKRQKASRRLKGIAQKQKTMKRKGKLRAKAKARAKASLKKKLEQLPVTFTMADAGEKGAKGQKAREMCLERLKLRSPELSFEQSIEWPDVKKAWCSAPTFRKIVKLKPNTDIGVHFLTEVNKILKELGNCYKGPTKFNKADPTLGDSKAFSQFFLRMQKDTAKPRAASSVVM